MPVHRERREEPWSADQMYAIVADVARYPEFLPWCLAARVRRARAEAGGREILDADLAIGFKGFRERFASRVTLDPKIPRVDVEYLDGPFKHLHNRWIFEPRGVGSVIDFHVDFEFRNWVLAKAMNLVFGEAVRRMVAAFEARAEALYGRPEAAREEIEGSEDA